MRHRLLIVPLAIILTLIYLPLASVVLFSFNESSAPIMPIKGFTTDWYGVLFDDEVLRQALWTSVKIGLLTVLIVLVLATLAALALRGRRFRGRGAYEAVLGMPFLLPEVVTGISLLTLFNALELAPSITTILVGHVLFCLAAGLRVIAARVEGLPKAWTKQHATSGVGRSRRSGSSCCRGCGRRSVTAALLVFALLFDQTVITILVAGTENTLPTLLWAKLRLDTTPEVNALASLILAFSFLVAIPLGARAGRDLVR